MADTATIFRIALVGGEEFCKDVLQKYLVAREAGDSSARIVAVADPEPQSPGMALAKSLGLIALED
jgi:two-component system, NtrC family, sensor kinase